jgi:hypothetical protein
VIMATVHGQIYAVDSAHGNIVWKTSLNDDASELDIVGMWNVRSGPEFGAPVVAIVANKNAAGVNRVQFARAGHAVLTELVFGIRREYRRSLTISTRSPANLFSPLMMARML